MKVVLFCGGQGTRIRDYSEAIPKPIVPIGYRPILWHIMKYYAHFGHTDFILCLGYKADVIKNYFVNYEETISNDFVLNNGKIDLITEDINGWNITFVDTGVDANIGMRLKLVQPHLAGEEIFMANYADGLADLDLNHYLDFFKKMPQAVGSFVSSNPKQSFHMIKSDEDNWVTDITPMSSSDIWINTGYFIFRQSIFDYINFGEELVEEPFTRLSKQKKLLSYRNMGFWQAMDTFKDKMLLDQLQAAGSPPWEVWKK